MSMRNRASFIVTAAVALAVVFVVGNRLTSVQGQGAPTRVAAVPGEKGGQDMFGAYNVQVGWPKPLSGVPGVGKWTWGAGQGVFAESPNRVFVLERGMLPEIERPKTVQIAPSVEFPIGRLPWRDATSASPPGALFKQGTQEPGDDLDAGKPDVDYKWARIINVIDAQGNHIEDWTQYDKMFRRPHSVFESPYDPQKDVWIVDDYRHAIFRFSNDGKRLLQTIGTVNVPGTDATHFYRPTFMAWAPNGELTVASMNLDGGAGAVTLSADGLAQETENAEGIDLPLGWSPDGGTLAVRALEGETPFEAGASHVELVREGSRERVSDSSDVTIVGWSE